jgi:predicted nuclease of predicted toxin-antitoxin system
MAKFLVDESTGKRLALLLMKHGYDVIFAGDWRKSALDDDVLEKAYKEKRVLITDDKDFGELVFRRGRKSAGVILLRTRITDPYFRIGLLKRLIDHIDVNRKFIVVKENAIRISKKW